MAKWLEKLHPRKPDGKFTTKGGSGAKAPSPRAQRRAAQRNARVQANSAKRLERRNREYHDLRSVQNQFLPEQARDLLDNKYPEHKGKSFGAKPKDIPNATFRPSAAQAADLRREYVADKARTAPRKKKKK